MSDQAIALMMVNGRLDDEVVLPYLQAVADSGYRGVCIHPRDGLTVPYGSTPFWDGIERIIARARQQGLDVWFYDEFSFPSGADGGRLVARHPNARARELKFVDVPAVPDHYGVIDIGPGDLLALLRVRRGSDKIIRQACDVTDRCGTLRNRWLRTEVHDSDYLETIRVRQVAHDRAVTTVTTNAYQPDRPLDDGEELVAVLLAHVPAASGEAGMPDVALPEVTDSFLNEVYLRYARYASQFGLDGVPIFQDEVKYAAELPWNRELQARLCRRWGNEWRLRLIALREPGIAGWELTRYEYREACAQAIEKNWFQRVSTFCRENGLRMTGHLAGEESIIGHWRHLGDPFRTLGHFDIPGYDVINPPATDDVHRSQAKGAKLVQSAAWLAGQKTTMAEVFGANGFHSDPQQARTILAWLGMHDILTPVDHSAWTSAISVRKYDAPPVNTRFNPLRQGYTDMYRWHDWFVELLREYAFDPEALVLLPQESFARYRPAERDRWADEVALLETFFHYVSAATLDTVLIPSDVLSEIEPAAAGFALRGRRFRTLLVPPVRSVHERVYDRLERFADHPGLRWVLSPAEADTGQIRVFGPSHPDGAAMPVRAARIASCSEDDLLRRKATFFDDLLQPRAAVASTDQTVIKSIRRRGDGSTILVLANPHPHELTVRFPASPGRVLPQPPHGCALPLDDDGRSLRLPPRDVAVVAMGDSPESRAGTHVLADEGVTYRIFGRNQLRLEAGLAQLDGCDAVPFHPDPISLLWSLDGVTDWSAGVSGKASRSSSELGTPRRFKVSFDIEIESVLGELLVVLDAESMPPSATLWWDGLCLVPDEADVFDIGNTVHPIPEAALAVGRHTLRVEAIVSNAGEGLLEHPILVGSFVAALDGVVPRLAEAPRQPRPWKAGTSWRDLGIPHGHGPIEYTAQFTVRSDDAGPGWAVRLPECIGVADVSVDGHPTGRSSWERRVVPIDGALDAGRHVVTVVLHGSWNNVFSRLNTVTNGLLGRIELVRVGGSS